MMHTLDRKLDSILDAGCSSTELPLARILAGQLLENRITSMDLLLFQTKLENFQIIDQRICRQRGPQHLLIYQGKLQRGGKLLIFLIAVATQLFKLICRNPPTSEKASSCAQHVGDNVPASAYTSNRMILAGPWQEIQRDAWRRFTQSSRAVIRDLFCQSAIWSAGYHQILMYRSACKGK